MTNEQLVVRIQAGDNIGENMLALYLQVKPFLHYIAMKYKGLEEVEDLEQEAYFGLYAAIDDYDPERGFSFLTFAGTYIRNHLRKYLVSRGSLLRLSPHCREGLIRYRRFCESFQKEYGREPEEKETARYLGIQINQVRKLKEQERLGRLGSLDSPVQGFEGEATVLDTLAAEEDMESTVLDKIEQEELKALIWPMVDGLPERQAQVIRARFQERLTLRETGERIGTNIEGARQWENKALKELRKPSRAKYLRPFLPEADRIYSISLRGSFGSFERTWTSSTEKAALKMMEG